MWAPELELLDQLCGGDLSLAVCQRLFSSREQFLRAARGLAASGHIHVVDGAGNEVEPWRWDELRFQSQEAAEASAAWNLSITPAGIAYFSRGPA